MTMRNPKRLSSFSSRASGDRPFVRYVWVTDGSKSGGQVTSLALNMLSRSGTIYRPTALGKDNLLVMRFDLRWYATRLA